MNLKDAKQSLITMGYKVIVKSRNGLTLIHAWNSKEKHDVIVSKEGAHLLLNFETIIQTEKEFESVIKEWAGQDRHHLDYVVPSVDEPCFDEYPPFY